MTEADHNRTNDVRFQAVLVPHRSLPRRGYALLIGGLAVGLGAIGLGFWSLGAWPVAGFCGLEILLVWGAFELNYRAGRVVEVIRLDDTQLHVQRVQPSGRSMSWTFDPGWVRVEIEETDDRTILQLAMHGRRTRLGGFLTDDERSSLGDALCTALVRWRSAPDAG
tara:strand:- start:404 stop:901 length:498 start_codon:yes stop_codon:yes gene_type:complete